MKSKKILYVFAILAVLACSLLAFAGCDDSSDSSLVDVNLEVYIMDGNLVTNQGYTLYTKDTSGQITIDQSNVYYEMVGNNSAAADINGNIITATQQGVVEIRAVYNYEGTFYRSVETKFVFYTLDLALSLPNTPYVGGRLPLSWNANINGTSVDGASLQEVTVISGDAVIEVSGDSYYLIANSVGDVTVQAVCEFQGATYTYEETFTITDNPLRISTDATEFFVGYDYPLTATFNGGGIDPASVVYTVKSGDATVEGAVLRANAPGEVIVSASFEQDGTTYQSEELKVTFAMKSLAVSTDVTEFYINNNVTFSATLDVPEFDPARVIYTVKSGDATFTGSVLQTSVPGDVVVVATYEHGGVTYRSEDITLTFTYQGNTIVNADGLLALVNSADTFTLLADIDLSSIESWTPIEGFTGTLNGNGHTISGLNITARTMDENKGLFATIGGTVENLNIEGTVKCNGEAKYLGLLCGTNNGTIKNVTVSGTINTQNSDYVGGIAGYSNTSYMTNCTSNVTITARSYVGGHTGYMVANRSEEAVITENVNNGSITGASYVGGLYGWLGVAGGSNNHDTITFISNKNNGAVTATEQYVGGLIGYAQGESHTARPSPFGEWVTYTSHISITECENTADIIGTNYVGGIIGNAENYVSEISFCSNTYDITGNTYVGGYAGRANGTHFRNLTNNNTITGKAYLGGIAGYAGKIDGCTNNGVLNIVGFVMEGDNQSVSYAGGIAGFATEAVNCVNNANLDANAGGNYVGGIAGYFMATRSESNVVQGNKNHGSIMGQAYVGGLFGYFGVSEGNTHDSITVLSNTNDGEIIGFQDFVGGLIGYAVGESHTARPDPTGDWITYTANIKVMECENEANVIGTNYVGGIIGNAENFVSEISFGSSTGDVTGNTYVGGYAGRANGTQMRNLTNNSTVTGRSYVGGIAGYAGQCISCENNGNILNQGYGLTEDNTPISYLGGIAGYVTGAENCVNNSNIDASTGGDYVGGIAGYVLAIRSDTNEVKRNKNHGIIKGTAYVGGLFGYFGVQATPDTQVIILLTDNVNDGDVVGSKDYVGGLIGYAIGESHQTRPSSWGEWVTHIAQIKVTSCKNEANVTGADYVGGIVGDCALYVLPDEVIWNTNTFMGTLSATGENQGELYGHIG